MPTNSTTNSLAKISQYLYVVQNIKDRAFSGVAINSNKDIILYMERKALEYGIAQSISTLQGVGQYVYSLIGGKLQLANQVLTNGSGGIVVPSTNSGNSLRVYRNQFNVGDVGGLFTNGSTVATIDIGVGSNFIINSMVITLDQVEMPRNNSNYISYTVSYAAGIVTITLNQAAQTGQLYIITFDYIIA